MIEKAILHLSKDPVMKRIIKLHGPLEEDDETRDLFSSLVREIVYQQLSGTAANAIYKRFENLVHSRKVLDPVEILQVDHGALRGAGMSNAKARYIKHLAEASLAGQLDVRRLNSLSDREIISELTKIKGIGVWTAEMSLMFHFRRPDVFSISDVGLLNAVSKHYQVERTDKTKILAISRRWSPYRTYAARFLWKSIA